MLPTLPYQQANRYAVVDITSLILSQTRVVYLFTSRRIYKFTHLQTNKLNRLFTLPPFHLAKGEAVFSPFHLPSFQRRSHLFTFSTFHLSKGATIFSLFHPSTFPKAEPSFHSFTLPPFQRRSHLFTFSTFHFFTFTPLIHKLLQ